MHATAAGTTLQHAHLWCTSIHLLLCAGLQGGGGREDPFAESGEPEPYTLTRTTGRRLTRCAWCDEMQRRRAGSACIKPRCF